MPARRVSREKHDKARRSQIAKRLNELAEVLLKHQIINDTSPLTKAASSCLRYESLGEWGYQVSSLIFHQLDSLKVFPLHAKTPQLRLDLDIQGPSTVLENTDPLTFVKIEIEIYATVESNDGKNTIKQCWHFDRQPEEDETSEFSHPGYHFQFGGNKLKTHLADKPNHILLLDSPRLAHPPMDAVLGVDFVISNFVGAKNAKDCLNDNTYQRLVKEAQQELWKPYIHNLHGVWEPNASRLPWQPKLIWPQIIL